MAKKDKYSLTILKGEDEKDFTSCVDAFKNEYKPIDMWFNSVIENGVIIHIMYAIYKEK